MPSNGKEKGHNVLANIEREISKDVKRHLPENGVATVEKWRCFAERGERTRMRRARLARTCDNNWNQRGASKIDGNLIDFCKEKLFEFEQQPEIFPVFDGSLQLEFNDGKNCLEISLKKDLNKVDYYMEKNDRQIINTVKISSLIDIIDKFYQK